MKKLLILFLSLVSLTASAQDWGPLVQGVNTGDQTISYDPLTGKLFISGPTGTTVTLPTSATGTGTLYLGPTLTGANTPGSPVNVYSPPNSNAFVITAFTQANKFDNIGQALSSPQLSVASSGTGLVSATPGSTATGYLKMSRELDPQAPSRTDFLLSLNTSATESLSVGVGTSSTATTGYVVGIETNVGGNLRITFPSGASVSAAMSGTINANVSITSGNGTVTASFHVLGNPASLTASATNPFRVPVYEAVRANKVGLNTAYFATNAASSRIIGYLHSRTSWNGDPSGKLLTRSVVMNAAGWPGESDGARYRDHESLIFLPERASALMPLRVANFFHGRTQTVKSFFDVTQFDNAETARQLLLSGYAVIGTTGGQPGVAREADYWGNPTGTARAGEVYDVLAQNVTNVGNEYLTGWSMGGIGSLNYFRANQARVKAIWLSCPVTDLEESGNANSVQGSTTLKQSLDNAYMSFYTPTVNNTTADPQTDNVNYRVLSTPGGLPHQGARNFTVATVSAAVTNNNSVPTSAGSRFYPGDVVYFKQSGQIRQIIWQSTGQANNINLDSPVTLISGEQIAIIRSDNRPAPDYYWADRPRTEWTASSQALGIFVLRKSANPLNDVRPHNPSRYFDWYAQAAVPIRIMTGGDGTATGNDGILNNQPMYNFRDGANAFRAGTVSILPGSGGHISSGNISASDLLTLFNAN